MTSSFDRLEPWDIVNYGMQTTRIRCKCGQVSDSHQLWVTYRKDRGIKSRRLGFSEQLYANIPLKRSQIEEVSRACPSCLGVQSFEAWTKPESTGTTNLSSQAKSSFAEPAGYGVTRTKKAAKASAPPPVDINELLGY
jgi:hypothetical protein